MLKTEEELCLTIKGGLYWWKRTFTIQVFLCMWWVKPEYKCETTKHCVLYKQNQTVTSVDSQWQKKNSVKRSVRWAKSHKNFSIKSCRAESSSSNRGKNWWKDTYSDHLRVFLEKKERKKERRGGERKRMEIWKPELENVLDGPNGTVENT